MLFLIRVNLCMFELRFVGLFLKLVGCLGYFSVIWNCYLRL